MSVEKTKTEDQQDSLHGKEVIVLPKFTTARHFPAGEGSLLGAIDALHQKVFNKLEVIPPKKEDDLKQLDELKGEAEKLLQKVLSMVICCSDTGGTATALCELLSGLMAQEKVLLSVMSLSDFNYIKSFTQHRELHSAAILSGFTASSPDKNRAKDRGQQHRKRKSVAQRRELPYAAILCGFKASLPGKNIAKIRVQQVRKTLCMVLLMVIELKSIIKKLEEVQEIYYNEHYDPKLFGNGPRIKSQAYVDKREEVREKLQRDFLSRYYTGCKGVFKIDNMVEWEDSDLAILKQLRVLFIDESTDNHKAVQADLTKAGISFKSIQPIPNENNEELVSLIKTELESMQWLDNESPQDQSTYQPPFAASSSSP